MKMGSSESRECRHQSRLTRNSVLYVAYEDGNQWHCVALIPRSRQESRGTRTDPGTHQTRRSRWAKKTALSAGPWEMVRRSIVGRKGWREGEREEGEPTSLPRTQDLGSQVSSGSVNTDPSPAAPAAAVAVPCSCCPAAALTLTLIRRKTESKSCASRVCASLACFPAHPLLSSSAALPLDSLLTVCHPSSSCDRNEARRRVRRIRRLRRRTSATWEHHLHRRWQSPLVPEGECASSTSRVDIP